MREVLFEDELFLLVLETMTSPRKSFLHCGSDTLHIPILIWNNSSSMYGLHLHLFYLDAPKLTIFESRRPDVWQTVPG